MTNISSMHAKIKSKYILVCTFCVLMSNVVFSQINTDSTKVDSVEYDGVEHFFGKNRIDTTDLYTKKFFLGFNAGFSNMIIGDLEKNTPSSLYRLQFGYNLDSKYCIFLDGAKGTLESYTPKNSWTTGLHSVNNFFTSSINGKVSFNDIFKSKQNKTKQTICRIYVTAGIGLIDNYLPNIEIRLKPHKSDLINNFKKSSIAAVLPLNTGLDIRLPKYKYLQNTVFNINFQGTYSFSDYIDGYALNFSKKTNLNDVYGFVTAGIHIYFNSQSLWKDTDNDGIKDKKDKCPLDFGPLKFEGCPDVDGDGIPDWADSCVFEPGPAKYNGCPDTDGDGIIDKNDSCPTVFGSKLFNGCPDRDGDGIADKDDYCPDVPGLIQFHGCPDTDGDGIPDNEDSCKFIAGSILNHGCPITDSVKKDIIIRTFEEIANSLAIPINFQFGKTIIPKGMFPLLDTASDVLKDMPNTYINIEGYADNIGKVSANKRISTKRAIMVKKYMVNKGVDPKRLVTRGYGSKHPIANNATKAGRSKNRRVVLKLKELQNK